MTAATFESSTYFQWEVVSLRASLIKIRESSGPTRVPWGTPQVKGRKVEVSPCMRTVWQRLVRKFASQMTIHSRIPCVADDGSVVNHVECFAKVNEGGGNGSFAFFEIVVDVIQEADERV